MAMVISPRSKIVTLSLLIGIITVVALIITGVVGLWHKSEKPTKPGAKVVSSKLQQITGYTATKHVSRTFYEVFDRFSIFLNRVQNRGTACLVCMLREEVG